MFPASMPSPSLASDDRSIYFTFPPRDIVHKSAVSSHGMTSSNQILYIHHNTLSEPSKSTANQLPAWLKGNSPGDLLQCLDQISHTSDQYRFTTPGFCAQPTHRWQQPPRSCHQDLILTWSLPSQGNTATQHVPLRHNLLPLPIVRHAHVWAPDPQTPGLRRSRERKDLSLEVCRGPSSAHTPCHEGDYLRQLCESDICLDWPCQIWGARAG